MKVEVIAKTIVESGRAQGIEFTEIKEAEFKYSLQEGFHVFFTFDAKGKGALALANNTQHKSFAAYERGEYTLTSAWKIKKEDAYKINKLIEFTGELFNGEDADSSKGSKLHEKAMGATEDLLADYNENIKFIASEMNLPENILRVLVLKCGLVAFKDKLQASDNIKDTLKSMLED